MPDPGPIVLNRRTFLALAGVGGVALAACGTGTGTAPPANPRGLPSVPRAAETGRVREYLLDAAPMDLRLGSRTVSTWGYNGQVPGPEIRAEAGDTLRVRVRNNLPEDTTVHWHGVPLANAMDGVPGVTQPPVRPGEEFTYEYVVPIDGTFWYHSHVGLQLDRGLYAPLIVDSPGEGPAHDREYTLLLDDWLDGVDGLTPRDDVQFPLFLLNGRPPEDPPSLIARRGERILLRLVNAGSRAVFRVAVSGHRMQVVRSDSEPVQPVTVDALRISMGERYDVLVQADNPGVHQVAAIVDGLGQDGLARAVLRYEEAGESSAPPADAVPVEAERRLLTLADLQAAEELGTFPADGVPDRTYDLVLDSEGEGADRLWTINRQAYPDADPLPVAAGEWIRVRMTRRRGTHPMHLHGHIFQVRNATGRGPFKDTVLLDGAQEELEFDFVADNPGEWLFHCHQLYHMEHGMSRLVSYTGS